MGGGAQAAGTRVARRRRASQPGGGPRVAAVVVALGREGSAGSAAATVTPPRTAPNAADLAEGKAGSGEGRGTSAGSAAGRRAAAAERGEPDGGVALRRAPATRNVVARPEEAVQAAEDASLDPRSTALRRGARSSARSVGRGRHRHEETAKADGELIDTMPPGADHPAPSGDVARAPVHSRQAAAARACGSSRSARALRSPSAAYLTDAIRAMFPGTPGASTDEWQQFLATDIDQNGEVSAFELQRMPPSAPVRSSLQTVARTSSAQSSRQGQLEIEAGAVKQFLSKIQAGRAHD